MIKYLFCHGFGFAADYWKNFSPLLTKGEANFIDLGYFNKRSDEDILQSYGDNNSLKIGIGHSLGFMKLINSGIKFDLLIGINAFHDFLGPAELYNQRKDEHTKLLEHFNKSPIPTLKNFYRRGGLKTPLDNLEVLSTTTLNEDLNFLLNHVALPQNIPILIINSLDDIIVPPALTLANFSGHKNVSLKLLKSGSHSIILNNPEESSSLINNYLKNYV
jgi:pimeloyl-[acyl-carrier protein] methyl ester esterase